MSGDSFQYFVEKSLGIYVGQNFQTNIPLLIIFVTKFGMQFIKSSRKLRGTKKKLKGNAKAETQAVINEVKKLIQLYKKEMQRYHCRTCV